jgi:hypothetical protein
MSPFRLMSPFSAVRSHTPRSPSTPLRSTPVPSTPLHPVLRLSSPPAQHLPFPSVSSVSNPVRAGMRSRSAHFSRQRGERSVFQRCSRDYAGIKFRQHERWPEIAMVCASAQVGTAMMLSSPSLLCLCPFTFTFLKSKSESSLDFGVDARMRMEW